MATSDWFAFLTPDPHSPGGRRGRGGRRPAVGTFPRAGDEADKSDVRVHLLDVGTQEYGDCLLLELGGQNVLVDGGHLSNMSAQGNAPSIPTQLEHLLGMRPPFKIDLLVATHCHADHVGCLPELVNQHYIDVAWALVIDESFGFPHTLGPDARLTDGPVSRLISALFEEKRPESISDAELQQFLQDAAKISERYSSMLETLAKSKTRIIRYGHDDPSGLQRAFSSIGLEILGPSKRQLEICRDFLLKVARDAADHLLSRDDLQDLAGEARLYREIIRQWTSADDAVDRVGPGAAENNQSIVLKFDINKTRILLTGDMQFAKPEVAGLDKLMADLRSKLQAAGPYHFVKIAHHGSYNAFNEEMLRQLQDTKAFATSNGTNDATHPDASVLKLLNDNKDRLEWARTDRNGSVTVTFVNGTARMEVSRGHLNDATPNTDASTVLSPIPAAREPAKYESPTLSVRPTTEGRIQFSASAHVPDTVNEVTVTFTARSPGEGTRATSLTRTLEPEREPQPRALQDTMLAGGRRLPQLLFVTNTAKLAVNLGKEESQQIIGMIRSADQTLLEIRDVNAPFGEIRRELSSGKYKGTVLVGGYDVLSPQRLDVLDRDLRKRLADKVANDADQYIVWSDAVYGDVDGDGLPELPVSRVPDGKSPRLVTAALTATTRRSNSGKRFGLRNAARPFATSIFAEITGQEVLLVSEPTTPTRVGVGGAAGDYLYFMLHGSDADATRFWGEQDGGTVEGFNISNVPASGMGVVFTGCCWGALIADTIASKPLEGRSPASRSPDSSIALAYLQSGICAFIGCTGSHYSPTEPPYDYFGGPMHQAFWTRYNEGRSPAEALFAAKLDYVAGMPHGQSRLEGQAIEMKILREYTCLGLGW